MLMKFIHSYVLFILIMVVCTISLYELLQQINLFCYRQIFELFLIGAIINNNDKHSYTYLLGTYAYISIQNITVNIIVRSYILSPVNTASLLKWIILIYTSMAVYEGSRQSTCSSILYIVFLFQFSHSKTVEWYYHIVVLICISLICTFAYVYCPLDIHVCEGSFKSFSIYKRSTAFSLLSFII